MNSNKRRLYYALWFVTFLLLAIAFYVNTSSLRFLLSKFATESFINLSVTIAGLFLGGITLYLQFLGNTDSQTKTLEGRLREEIEDCEARLNQYINSSENRINTRATAIESKVSYIEGQMHETNIRLRSHEALPGHSVLIGKFLEMLEKFAELKALLLINKKDA